ncbi:hypothetical protein Lal_00006712 [Lupinus albus]|nr:hypothetical protein Lal_00006712 [Lupinus albus]
MANKHGPNLLGNFILISFIEIVILSFGLRVSGSDYSRNELSVRLFGQLHNNGDVRECLLVGLFAVGGHTLFRLYFDFGLSGHRMASSLIAFKFCNNVIKIVPVIELVETLIQPRPTVWSKSSQQVVRPVHHGYDRFSPELNGLQGWMLPNKKAHMRKKTEDVMYMMQKIRKHSVQKANWTMLKRIGTTTNSKHHH